jgi:hypothetical protein
MQTIAPGFPQFLGSGKIEVKKSKGSETDTFWWLSTELLENDLAQLLQRCGGTFTWNTVSQIAVQIVNSFLLSNGRSSFLSSYFFFLLKKFSWIDYNLFIHVDSFIVM